MVYLNHCKEFLLIWLFSYFVINIAINEILPFVTITRLFKFNLPISNRGMGNKLPATTYGTRKVVEGGIGASGYVPKFFDYMHFLQDICCHPPTPELRRGGSRIPRRRGRQHLILPNFAKNCMKSKKIWAVGRLWTKKMSRLWLGPLNLPLLRYPHGESFLWLRYPSIRKHQNDDIISFLCLFQDPLPLQGK